MNYLQQRPIKKPKTRFERFADYLATRPGRRFSSCLIGVSVVGAAAVNLLPHTVFLETYRELIQHYTFSIPTRVPKDVRQRIDDAMERLKIEQSAKERIKAFIVTGFNVVDIGSLYTPYGGYIGLPSNYCYKSVNHVDKANIYIRSEPVDWNSPAGKSLAESLVLNESEQAFGISRAILELQSDKLLLNTILPSLSLTAMYLTAKRLNVTLDLFNKPRGVRGLYYLLIGFFTYGICSFALDFNRNYDDKEIDQTLANLGLDMIEGGIGFYDKQLKRNIAIRKISSKDLYTAKGDAKYLVRIREKPLSLRKAYFEKKREALNKKDEQPTDAEQDNAKNASKENAAATKAEILISKVEEKQS